MWESYQNRIPPYIICYFISIQGLYAVWMNCRCSANACWQAWGWGLYMISWYSKEDLASRCNINCFGLPMVFMYEVQGKSIFHLIIILKPGRGFILGYSKFLSFTIRRWKYGWFIFVNIMFGWCLKICSMIY